MVRQVFVTRMVYRETCKSNSIFLALYRQEFNPWSSNIPEHTSPHVMSESQTPPQDQRCQSGPSAKDSVIFSGGDFLKELWGRPTTTADFRSSF